MSEGSRFEFLGKRVLITGGGSGTGADMARGFAGAGAHVVIAGRGMAALRAVAGDAMRAFAVDVGDEASVAALWAAEGPFDIVIANAGAAASAPLARQSLDGWNDLMAVNLTGVFLTFREGLRQGRAPRRLIAVASVAGLRGYPYIGAYAAAKHGVVGLVRSVADEVALKGITVNAICPGYLETEMTARSLANIIEKTGKSEAEARAVLEAASPQARLFQPAEVTATALWLASAAAAGVNGQAIAISGGSL